MKGRGKTIINLICSIAVLVCNTAINFWLSPFIVESVGVEANGFVSLASNFVMYAQLIVTALNSMASRFIALAYVKQDYEKANLYYNSVFWGKLIIVGVLLIPAIVLICLFERMFDVPVGLVTDVKILFSFVFFNFFLSTSLPNWDCGTYVTNRLDRTYIPNVIAMILRCAFLIVALNFITTKIYIVGIAATIMTVINLLANGYNTHVLTPELKISFRRGGLICSKNAVRELVGSGIWNSLSNVGNLLLSGLDLLICNLFLGATAMGILTLAKTLPHLMQNFSSSITQVFAPEMMINYAEGKKDVLLNDINRAMKITSVLLIIPLAGIIAMSDAFFSLWVPGQDSKILSILAIICCAGYAFTSGTQILYNVFTVTNHVRMNAILMALSGVVSTGIVFILLKTTNLGIYAVAGVSVVVCWVRNMAYTIPFTAKYLGYKKTQFFPQVILCVVSTVVLSGVGILITSCFHITNWWQFIGVAALVGTSGLIINLFVFLRKEERKILFGKLVRKFKRRKAHEENTQPAQEDNQESD